MFGCAGLGVLGCADLFLRRFKGSVSVERFGSRTRTVKRVKLDVKRSRQDTQRYDPTYWPAWVNSPRAKKEEKIRRSNPHTKKKKKLFIFDSKCRNNKIRPRNKSRLASQLAGLLTDFISRSSRSWQGLMLLQAFLNSIVSVC